MARVKPNMVLDETRNEKIAVIVAVLHPQLERYIALDACRSQEIGLELNIQERVLGPLVDEATLIAGNLVAINRILDLRDADLKAWREALARLEAMQCRHLIPAYGPAGNCADIAAFARYFSALESRVDALMNEGVSLAELRYRCDLPEYARWDQYETLHPQNANYTYLRLERSQFK